MQRISNVKCLGLLVWFCMFLYSVCVLLLSWKPLVTRNLEFIKIIIFKWLNSGAFGIKLYYSPCEIYGHPVIHTWMFWRSLTSAECSRFHAHQHVGLDTRCFPVQTRPSVNIRSVTLHVSGFSRHCLLKWVWLGLWSGLAWCPPLGLLEGWQPGVVMGLRWVPKPASHHGSQCGAQMYNAFPQKATRWRL